MQIRRLEIHDILPIRNEILRPKEILDDYKFEGDSDESTLHLGAYIDGRLSSVATFIFENHANLKAEIPVRLRGMATLPKYRCKGLSKALIETALASVKQNQCDVLWCEAREKAIGFYESLGFQPHSDMFEKKFIGPHRLMFLTIKGST